MKVIERVHGFIQPLKTSFGTAVTKASETVKKASEIASKILKVLFTPVTFLYDRAKTFYDKMRNQPASSDARPLEPTEGREISRNPQVAPGFSYRQGQASPAPAPAAAAVESDNSEDDEGPASSDARPLEPTEGREISRNPQVAPGFSYRQGQASPAPAPAAAPAAAAVESDNSEDDEGPAASFNSRLEQQVYENLRAQILGTKDNSLMSNLARRAHFEAKHEGITNVLNHRAKAKAKAEANSAAIGFLKNIVDGARIAHSVPTALGTRGVVKVSFQAFGLSNLNAAPVIQGGSAADFPPLTNEIQNKSARRRNLKP